MAKKITEMTGAELAAALVSIAEPIGNLANDEKLFEALKQYSAHNVNTKLRMPPIERAMKMFAALVPLLFGQKHLADIVKITSVIEGVPAEQLLAMPGVDLINDVREAWKEQIAPFFGLAERQA